MLIKRFAQGSALQSAISSASAVLQSTDEMEMAELHDPALARTEPDDCLRPAPQVFSAWLKYRIEEDSSILMARLDRHHIQDPVFSSKAEIKSVQAPKTRVLWASAKPEIATRTVAGRDENADSSLDG
jgi:hypothetical protein